MIVSIFNDVIGPVMRGPSSSHCAAALRIGRLARDLMDADFHEVLVEFDRLGALPTTHESQGSDMGLFGGLLGWDAADERLPDSPQALRDAGVQVRIAIIDVGDEHPNTYRLTLRNGRQQHFLRAISTGGGMMEVINVDGFTVSLSGDCHETLLWVNGDGHAVVRRLTELAEAGVSRHDHHVAAGILPAVEGGILPPGPAPELSSRITGPTVIPPGRMPGSTAGKMPAATAQGDGTAEIRPVVANAILLHESGGQYLVEVKAARFVSEETLAALRLNSSLREVKRLAPVLPVSSRKDTRVPFTTCEEMLRHDAGRNTPLWKLAAEYEMARGNLTEPEVISRMTEIIRILRRSIRQGIAGTQYDDRVLGHQSGKFNDLMKAGRLLNGGALNRIVLYVSALMEVKSAMGVIVAAPTAGACAALPAAVIAMAEEMALGEDDMAKALLASGVIGVFIATRWTFAAEVGGCQAEGGSAACMAAAALVTLAGGTLAQSVAAASMAFQSMLGLICDPVASRVEVPCLGKNVMAASNALSCANMALADYDPVIPLDEVIETAQRVAAQMPRELRCTALGGLALTKTSQALEQKLAARKAAACAASCRCAG